MKKIWDKENLLVSNMLSKHSLMKHSAMVCPMQGAPKAETVVARCSTVSLASKRGFQKARNNVFAL